jgi:hypothetical protein
MLRTAGVGNGAGCDGLDAHWVGGGVIDDQSSVSMCTAERADFQLAGGIR